MSMIPNRLPSSLLFSLTNACNANCVFCYRREFAHAGRLFPLARYRQLLLETHGSLKSLNLSGVGEPTMHPDFPLFLEVARDLYAADRLFITVTSNGSRLSEEICAALLHNEVNEVWISMNAVTQETHSRVMPGLRFRDIVEGIGHLVRMRSQGAWSNTRIRASFVVTKDNWFEAELFPDYALDMGVDIVSIGCVDRELNKSLYEMHAVGLKEFQAVHERLDLRSAHDKRIKCAPKWAFWPEHFKQPGCERDATVFCGNAEECLGVFVATGEATFCCYMARHLENEGFCIGNVMTETIVDIWNGPASIRLRQMMRNGPVPEICRLCSNYWNKRWINKTLDDPRGGLRGLVSSTRMKMSELYKLAKRGILRSCEGNHKE